MQEEQLAGGTLQTLTPQEVAERFARNEIVLIDVRTPNEYAFEHIRGALLGPMATFEPNNLPTQEAKAIVFHCGSGIRSRAVAGRYLDAGFERIAHMGGGFTAWKQAGLPYVATDPATGGPKNVPGKS
ncbi:MAG: rhodanese-like domain-containing protein [Geminicoccaceae bacterium]